VTSLVHFLLQINKAGHGNDALNSNLGKPGQTTGQRTGSADEFFIL